jgi:hypothetical protein
MNTDNTQGDAEPSPASAGSQPVAWAVFHAHGTTVWDSETQARKVANEWLASRVWVWAEVVPLFRSPALTAEEREAIACAAESYADNDDDEDCARVAATLRGVIERLG